METDRADGFYESCHRMRVRATEKGWRRSFSFFLAFFSDSPLPRSCEDRREKGETPPADRLQRRRRHRRRAAFKKETFCKMRARARIAYALRFQFCMPACHLRRQARLVVYRQSVTWSQLILSTPLSAISFVLGSRGSIDDREDLIQTEFVASLEANYDSF